MIQASTGGTHSNPNPSTSEARLATLQDSVSKARKRREGWRHGSVGESRYCTCKGPELDSQHTYSVTHLWFVIPVQGLQCSLLDPVDTYTHIPISAHRPELKIE